MGRRVGRSGSSDFVLSCLGEFNLCFLTSIHSQGGGEAEQKRIQETIEKYEKLNEISDESVEAAAEVLETVQEEEAATEAAEATAEVTTKQTEEVAVTEDNIEEIVDIEEEVENVSNNEIVARVELKIASPEDNGKC